MRTRAIVLVWAAATLVLAGYLALELTGEDRRLFLPGRTTDGHHQIELACDSCHSPFGGVRQQSCLDCHEEELEAAEDSHGDRKFADPRNAADLERLDARRCVTCHTEHRLDITGAMGLTLPADFCLHCHAEVGEERPSHQGFGFDTCASGGCHKYHDNRSLYEDFLARHGRDPVAAVRGLLPPRSGRVLRDGGERTALAAGEAEATAGLPSAGVEGGASAAPELVAAWAASSHALAEVGCPDCHEAGASGWTDRPAREMCGGCHELEIQGFQAGRHGMRWSVGLASMSPAEARLAMKQEALARTIDCGACHDVHGVDVRAAAVEGCLACHADEHSLAYVDSPHHRLWRREAAGAGEPGSGVSCATCHLPRERRRIAGEDRIVVEHNQNANLRPNEKMIRGVCMTCHSLALSVDALADRDLIRRNFDGRPARHVDSIDMALARLESDEQEP